MKSKLSNKQNLSNVDIENNLVNAINSDYYEQDSFKHSFSNLKKPWFVIEIIAYEDYMCVKIFHFKCVYTGQPVSEISEFLTAYIHKCTVKP